MPRVTERAGPGPRVVAAAIAACVVLVGVALAVRGLEPRPRPLPEDDPAAQIAIPEPLQLLRTGAARRIRELDVLVRADERVRWRALRSRVFAIDGCPALIDWLATDTGQRTEALLAKLRAGSSADALAGLALVFQIARATNWSPGLMGRAHHAERLGELLQDWLRVRAPQSVDDPLLREPALAATLLYGRVLRAAYDAPMIGRNDAAYERARGFLADLCGTRQAQRTPFGRALQAAHPRAAAVLESEDDFLAGLRAEAVALFPDVHGGCGE